MSAYEFFFTCQEGYLLIVFALFVLDLVSRSTFVFVKGVLVAKCDRVAVLREVRRRCQQTLPSSSSSCLFAFSYPYKIPFFLFFLIFTYTPPCPVVLDLVPGVDKGLFLNDVIIFGGYPAPPPSLLSSCHLSGTPPSLYA